MNLSCVYLDHRNSTVSQRSGLWEDLDQLKEFVEGGTISECLPLHTCNRVELYMLHSGNELPAELLPTMPLSTLKGLDAVDHLIRVLLGLESMACGESFVVSQVKKEYERYRPLCGPILNRLVQRCLNAASILRTEFHPGRAPSIPWLMVQSLREHRLWPSIKILVLGAGEMGEETAKVLRASQLPFSIANRTDHRAKELASATGGSFLPWDRWEEEAKASDVVIFTTASPEPIMDCGPDSPWCLDMGGSAQVRDMGGKVLSIDHLKERSEELLKDYRKDLTRLERETQETAQAIWANLLTVQGDANRRLAMMRVGQIVESRATQTAQKTGASEEVLRQMAWSVAKAVLAPVLDRQGPHSSRLWRVLAEGVDHDS